MLTCHILTVCVYPVFTLPTLHHLWRGEWSTSVHTVAMVTYLRVIVTVRVTLSTDWAVVTYRGGGGGGRKGGWSTEGDTLPGTTLATIRKESQLRYLSNSSRRKVWLGEIVPQKELGTDG